MKFSFLYNKMFSVMHSNEKFKKFQTSRRELKKKSPDAQISLVKFENGIFLKLANKKSQIFMFDMILSIVILVVSLAMIFSYFVTTTNNLDIYDYNYQILSGFTQTKINTLNNEDVRKMFINNQIRNIDNTVAQQVGEFYSAGNISLAQNLTKIFVKDYVNKQMSFRITIYNQTNNDTGTQGSVVLFQDIKNNLNSIEDGTISSVTQRTIFGFRDKDKMYGPDIIIIELWM